MVCPWQQYCKSKDLPDLEQIPTRKKLAKKEQHGYVYLIYNDKGEVFIRKRTEKGLLFGLYEFPWNTDKPVVKGAENTGVKVTHIFTHIKLTLEIYKLAGAKNPCTDGVYVKPSDLKNYALSTLMKKVFAKSK